jgi:integrase
MPTAARKIALTDRSLKAMKVAPDGRRQVVWDAMMPGLCVRISGRGKRSFFAVRRRAGDAQPTWVLLGQYPIVSLAEAREAARGAIGSLIAGRHPTGAREAAAAAAREAEETTFAKVAAAFAAKHFPEVAPSSARMYQSYLDRQLIPALGGKQVAAITRRDVIRLVEDVAASSGKASAIGCVGVLRKCLSWAMARDIVAANIATGVRLGELIGASKSRDRLLSDAELAAIWSAIPMVGDPWATVYRLLLLTGLRLNEVATARWENLDLDAGSLLIPSEDSKNSEAQLVPLPPLAVELLTAIPRFSGPYIFSTCAGRRPVQSASAAKRRLDSALTMQGVELPAFRVHDYRRVVRSGLGRLGVPTVVAELVLGHRQRGVAAVYDRHSYLDEKRAALTRWQQHLLSIIAPAPDGGGKVVALPARARG